MNRTKKAFLTDGVEVESVDIKDLLKHHWKKLYSSCTGSVNLYRFFNAIAGRLVLERKNATFFFVLHGSLTLI